MRVAELSQRSGVSIPSIKHYLREGLLPPGEALKANQASYSDDHLRRLRLIRALIEVGGLGLTAVKEVLGAIDDPAIEGHELLGVAHGAIARQSKADRSHESWRAARAEAGEKLAQLGWQVHPEAESINQLADAIAALRALDQTDLLVAIDGYAPVMLMIAQVEVDLVLARGETAGVVEGVVTGTILGEAVMTALRRLAQEHISKLRTS